MSWLPYGAWWRWKRYSSQLSHAYSCGTKHFRAKQWTLRVRGRYETNNRNKLCPRGRCYFEQGLLLHGINHDGIPHRSAFAYDNPRKLLPSLLAGGPLLRLFSLFELPTFTRYRTNGYHLLRRFGALRTRHWCWSRFRKHSRWFIIHRNKTRKCWFPNMGYIDYAYQKGRYKNRTLAGKYRHYRLCENGKSL